MKGLEPVRKLVIGGCRSGKSRYAEEWVTDNFPERIYVATLVAMGDPEMEHRIALHRRSRSEGWRTMEEPVELAGLLARHDGEADAFLVDCLTLWITNLMLRDHDDGAIEAAVARLAETVAAMRSTVVLVANEVGLGLVPESAMGRRFRDLAGWTNQRMAQVCDQVVLVAAGLPLRLKG
ncbi:MAG: bifunctional adenosylcobinamide kinase/adenosylcobinamide-phosphate guanylyltransferase [Thermodesulfobacteriota bacterium]